MKSPNKNKTTVPVGSSVKGPSSSPRVPRGDATPKATGTHCPVANQAGFSANATGMDSNIREIHKTKKPQGKNDARPSTNSYETFDNLYRPRNFTRSFSVKSTGEGNIAKANIFRVDKALKAYIGEFERMSDDLQNKSWTIEVKNEQQGEKLLTMTELLTEPITVTPHEFHNKSQGVITCSLLKEGEVTEGLSDYGVIAC